MASTRSSQREAYAAKMQAEIDALEDMGVVAGGNAFSSILVLTSGVSVPGTCEAALKASFERLAYAPEEWLWLSISRADGSALEREYLRRALVAFDPATVVVVSEDAAAALRDCFTEELADRADIHEALLTPGVVSMVRGVRVLNLGNFEATLADEAQKQLSWARLKQIPALDEPF